MPTLVRALGPVAFAITPAKVLFSSLAPTCQVMVLLAELQPAREPVAVPESVPIEMVRLLPGD